jgi:hypothetical protein
LDEGKNVLPQKIDETPCFEGIEVLKEIEETTEK